MQQFMTGEHVARITSVAGRAWVNYDADYLQGSYDFEVEGGSTEPRNEVFRRQSALQLVDAMAPFVEIGVVNPMGLARYVLQYGFEIKDVVHPARAHRTRQALSRPRCKACHPSRPTAARGMPPGEPEAMPADLGCRDRRSSRCRWVGTADPTRADGSDGRYVAATCTACDSIDATRHGATGRTRRVSDYNPSSRGGTWSARQWSRRCRGSRRRRTTHRSTDFEEEPKNYLDVDEVADRYVRVKVDGEERRGSPHRSACQGYSRTADYTRKTQELAHQRQQAEYALAVQRALQAQPEETLRLLARQYGIQPRRNRHHPSTGGSSRPMTMARRRTVRRPARTPAQSSSRRMIDQLAQRANSNVRQTSVLQRSDRWAPTEVPAGRRRPSARSSGRHCKPGWDQSRSR